ncbi:CopD family protein [Granulosicoccus sp. 3-233]|uniref:CopD family protein n=1 Tax=Granulosicoccus sp. 3-233 TaxID=3417969 RepID=UPI003D33D336
MKSLHVIFMVTWFAGLFYLPRVFVYHAMSDQNNLAQMETFKVMERKLMAMTNIGGLLTIVFGSLLLIIWLPGLLTLDWMKLKLLLVSGLIVYHVYCAHLVKVFRDDANTRSHVWYRWFNEVPVLFLAGIVILVIVRPFNG